MKKILMLSLLLLLCPASVYAGEIMGRVVKVADGDTITVFTEEKRQLKIRLYGIDCPESRQSFGQRAKQTTSAAVFGQPVCVLVRDKDRYGRSVAVVILPDGSVLQDVLLKAGLAWVYDAYCKSSECNAWRKQERQARADKRGLWADKDPVPPWTWRKR